MMTTDSLAGLDGQMNNHTAGAPHDGDHGNPARRVLPSPALGPWLGLALLGASALLVVNVANGVITGL